MDARRFSTLHEHPRDRPACWGQINQEFFGALDVESLGTGSLDAEMLAYALGPLGVYLIEAPAHRVMRNHTRQELPIDAVYKLVLQIEGTADIEQDHQRFRLGPGDWSLYDPRVPYAITNHHRARLLAVTLPRGLFSGLRMPSLHTCQAATPALQGLYAVLGSFLKSMAEQLHTLPQGAGQSVSDTVTGLLTSTLVQHRDEQSDAQPLPAVMKARVKQFVHAHLGDPHLTLDLIAEHLRCSKRYLHRVFEDEPHTLDRFIWLTRLESCHAALQQDGPRQRSISEIAFSRGFNSGAHFCRLFKAQYGVSPSEFQRRQRPALND